MLTVPKFVRDVLKILEQHGFKAYIVGGCVRDLLMGNQPQDWDVTTNATPQEIQGLFPRTAPTGIRHGTVTVITGKGNIEVTTFRREGAYTDHRRPDNVSYVSDLTVDLSRRDFTINAIAVPLRGIISDPFGGLEDIRQKRIRCVGEPEARFNEDALRMLRALRLSAKLDFSIEPDTAHAIAKCAHLTTSLSAERVRDELEKILLSKRPGVMSNVLEYGLLRSFTTDALVSALLIGRLSGVYRHKFRRWSAFTAILAHCGAIKSPEDFLSALKLDNKTLNTAAMGARLARRSMPEDKVSWKLLLNRYGADTVLCGAEAADVLAPQGAVKALKNVLKSEECFSLSRLNIGGDDLIALGLQPGPQVGHLLEELLLHVIRHPEDNQRSILISRAAVMTNGASSPSKKD